jgi:hypothetical protein
MTDRKPRMEARSGNSEVKAHNLTHKKSQSRVPSAEKEKEKEEVQDYPGTHYSSLPAPETKSKTPTNPSIYVG